MDDPLEELTGAAPPPPPASPPPGPDPASPSASSRGIVAAAFSWIEGAVVKQRGEHWRASDEIRAEIVRANAHALDLYAPDLDHPLLAAAASIGLWIAASIASEPKGIPNDGTPRGESEGAGTVEGPDAPVGPSIVTP